MQLKHNWGLIKNRLVGFRQINDETYSHKGILVNVKSFKDKVQFVFENKNMLEVSSDVLNKLLIRNESGVIWFIYEKTSSLVSGLIGFTMFDTYGFPMEITKEIMNENGMELDVEGFDVLRKLQKEKSQDSFKQVDAFLKTV